MSSHTLLPGRSVAIEVLLVDGEPRRVVRVGGTKIPAGPRLLAAVGRLVAGDEPADGDRDELVRAGVLVPPFDPASLPDRVTLAPDSRLAVRIEPTKVSAGVGPARSVIAHQLDQELFWMPYRLRILETLRRDLLAWWQRARALPGEPSDPAAAVAAWLTARYKADFHLQGVVDLDGSGPELRLVPHVPLVEPTPSFALAALVVHPPGAAPFEIPLDGWSDLAEIGPVLAALARTAGPEALAAAVGRSAPARRVLQVLAATGLLTAPEPASADLQDGDAVDLGGGSLVLKLGADVAWVDPWIEPAWRVVTESGHPAAVFLTQARLARCPLPTLLHLPRDTPIYHPPIADGPFASQLPGLLQLLGFTDVRAVAGGAEVLLPGGAMARAEAVEGGCGWTFESPAGIQAVFGASPHPLQGGTVRVIADRSHPRISRLTRGTEVFAGPVDQWLDAPSGVDWSALRSAAEAVGCRALVVVDSGARYLERALMDDPSAPAALRAYGQYADWGPDHEVSFRVSQPGARHSL